MILRVLTFLGLLAFLFPLVLAGHRSRHHQAVAHRARGDVDIHKRQSYSNAQFTYYDVGQGACGGFNFARDFIVALNSAQFGTGYPGPNCFKKITIQYNGQTTQATIMDECPGCPPGGLDFSEGLFTYFAPTSQGVLYGTWWYDNDDGGGGSQTTSTWTPPTSTWQPETTSSTPDYTPPPPPTSSSSSPTTSVPVYSPPSATSMTSTTSFTSSTPSTPSSNLNGTTSLISGLAVPTGQVISPGPGNPENILVINNILVEIGIALYEAEGKE